MYVIEEFERRISFEFDFFKFDYIIIDIFVLVIMFNIIFL